MYVPIISEKEWLVFLIIMITSKIKKIYNKKLFKILEILNLIITNHLLMDNMHLDILILNPLEKLNA